MSDCLTHIIIHKTKARNQAATWPGPNIHSIYQERIQTMDQTIIPHNVTIPTLLSISQDAKTIKGEAYGYLSAIQCLRPDSVLCPNASIECFKLCLNEAGRGAFSNVQRARLNRTNFFKQHLYGLYDVQLKKELDSFVKKAARLNLKPCARFNGTSDISIESIWSDTRPTIFDRYQEITWYDYTKNLNRDAIQFPGLHPYHLTFSYSGNNWRECQIAFHEYGHNIAVVFRDQLPKTWRGIPVLNGEISDLRFLDPKGHIVGLKAKGKARKEKSAFVVDDE